MEIKDRIIDLLKIIYGTMVSAIVGILFVLFICFTTYILIEFSESEKITGCLILSSFGLMIISKILFKVEIKNFIFLSCYLAFIASFIAIVSSSIEFIEIYTGIFQLVLFYRNFNNNNFKTDILCNIQNIDLKYNFITIPIKFIVISFLSLSINSLLYLIFLIFKAIIVNFF